MTTSLAVRGAAAVGRHLPEHRPARRRTAVSSPAGCRGFSVSGTTISALRGPHRGLVPAVSRATRRQLGVRADGMLYVSAGDGASFNVADYGQLGGTSGNPPPTARKPCAVRPQRGRRASLPGLRSEPVDGGGADLCGAVAQDAPRLLLAARRAVGHRRRRRDRSNDGTYVRHRRPSASPVPRPATAGRSVQRHRREVGPDHGRRARHHGDGSYERGSSAAIGGGHCVHRQQGPRSATTSRFDADNSSYVGKANVNWLSSTVTIHGTDWHHVVSLNGAARPGRQAVHRRG